MRIGAQLLNTGATVNSFTVKSQVEIHQGETTDLVFQLIDKDQDGLRYVPASGATVQVDIERFTDVFGTISNVRTEVDYSISQAAVQAFTGDNSVWKIPLTSTQTSSLMSSDIRITVTEGAKISKALIKQGIVVIGASS